MFEDLKIDLRKRLIKFKCDNNLTYYGLYLESDVSAHAIRCFILDECKTSIKTLDRINEFLEKKGY